MSVTECRSIHISVDLSKAFDTVCRDLLWDSMIKFGCPPRFIATVQAHLQNEGEFSEPFEVTNGIQQGCVTAPTLFSMMFSTMLKDAFQDSDTGFPIRKRFYGNILILRMLQAKNMAQTDVQDELFYADDMQRQTCKGPWRGCSTWKTAQCINHHCEQKLNVVDKFTYLESTLSRVVRHCQNRTKPVWHSADSSAQMSGSEMESCLAPR